MYPQAELDLLAQRKRDLLRSIRARREDLAGQVDQALRPIRLADWVYAKWREIMPALKTMAEPLGRGVGHALPPRLGDRVGGLFRWAPLALSFFRSIR